MRESRTPGSVGEMPGNRHLYPTQLCGVAECMDDAVAEGWADFSRLACTCRGRSNFRPPRRHAQQAPTTRRPKARLAVEVCVAWIFVDQ